MNYIRKAFGLVAATLLCLNVALADTPQNPVDLIQSTVNALQEQIQASGPALSKNPQKLYGIIKQTVMPYVAIDQMAGLALGPKWRSATSAQQQQFIDDFGLLLTKTYANALLTVSNYKITLNPIRGDAWQTVQYVAVNGQVTSTTNNKSSNITYYLQRSGDSWKIYDLAVEGVSFLKNYQDQFQSFQNMDTLLAKLSTMNS